MSTAPVPATLVIGHPRRGSRTSGVAHHTAKTIRAGLAEHDVDVLEPDVVDLADIGPALATAVADGCPDGAPVDRALDLLRRPGLLIAVSPTFKGSYTGLLKLLLDMLPLDGLGRGSVAVPVMTAGWPQHRFAADSHLRALLVELGAVVPVRALSVLESDFATLDTALEPWARAALPTLAAVLRQTRDEFAGGTGSAHAPAASRSDRPGGSQS
jgi:FMN reductase